MSAPTGLSRLESFGYDYWALGHVHERLLLSEGIAYCGNPGEGAEGGHVPRSFLELAIDASGGLSLG